MMASKTRQDAQRGRRKRTGVGGDGSDTAVIVMRSQMLREKRKHSEMEERELESKKLCLFFSGTHIATCHFFMWV